MKRILWILPILAMLSGWASATTRYVAQTAGIVSGGTACNGQTAITPATFNGLTLSAGDITYLCGTITASANTTAITIGQNGTSGSPISLLFDTGAILQAPYFAQYGNSGSCGGAICIANRSWIVIDGQNTGTIQNTANGSPPTANQKPSGGIEGTLGSNNIIRNLTIANLYVNTLGDGTLGDSSTVRAINFTGSNWLIQNNTIHDCGWCIVDFYNNGDSNLEISQNNIYDFGHAMAIAASAANAITTVKVHDNQIHDTANWGAPGCPFHNDGIHLFGTTGSSIDQFFYYNNYNYGNWGTCPTGFVFIEAAGSGTPSNLKNSSWWNNVFIIPSGSPADTSGWFELDQGASGTQTVVGNTFIGANATDNTLCMQMQGLNSLTYEDNVVSNCGDPIEISSSTMTAVDYNTYGPSCSNGGNCFIHNGAFAGSFTAWKTACACDAHGQQTNSPLLNANGSPQASSPVIKFGKNLASLATGNLATFANDTTLGNTRVSTARPAATTCTQGTATCPDDGAFQFASSGGTVANPTCTPTAGTYTTTQAPACSSATGGATLCYRIDGTNPTSSPAGTCGAGSTTYSGPLSISANTTVLIIGTLSGDTDSSVVSLAYIIAPILATPTFSPNGGSFFLPQTETITCPAGSTGGYTTDGSTPLSNGSGTITHGTQYTVPFSVSTNLTLKAICTQSGHTDSAVGSAVFTFSSTPPSPAPLSIQMVKLQIDHPWSYQ